MTIRLLLVNPDYTKQCFCIAMVSFVFVIGNSKGLAPNVHAASEMSRINATARMTLDKSEFSFDLLDSFRLSLEFVKY